MMFVMAAQPRSEPEKKMAKKFIVEVVSLETGLVIETVDCHDKTLRQAEKVMDGMLINMADEFYARVVEISPC